MKIYTKTGDNGMTSLANGQRVDKEVIAQGYALAEGSVSGVK